MRPQATSVYRWHSPLLKCIYRIYNNPGDGINERLFIENNRFLWKENIFFFFVSQEHG